MKLDRYFWAAAIGGFIIGISDSLIWHNSLLGWFILFVVSFTWGFLCGLVRVILEDE